MPAAKQYTDIAGVYEKRRCCNTKRLSPKFHTVKENVVCNKSPRMSKVKPKGKTDCSYANVKKK
jgi:hypothetical protein